MSSYSVATAKNALPSLIDKAIAGEEVVITRSGKPVAELRPTGRLPERIGRGTAALRLLRVGRDAMTPLPMTSVELLDAIYERDRD